MMEKQAGKTHKNKSIFFVLLVLILMSSTFLIGLFVGGAFKKASSEPVNDINGNSPIVIPGYDSFEFVAEETFQDVLLYNPEENFCYFRYSFILDDIVLWESDLLEPGMTISEIELYQYLQKGTFENASLKIDCFSLRDMSPLDSVIIRVILSVK